MEVQLCNSFGSVLWNYSFATILTMSYESKALQQFLQCPMKVKLCKNSGNVH